ncbi:expression site-associated gene (ESAG) protein,putative [Trypanosoma brucei gambiense DAL972]|uniref:Expression site-associated gene 5 (ESAG5) protein, putative n=1 Tax=Trypanosoma brucei gambiense (strain MHOM/CI/86/DAL972) TaxID=679716 RepID=D0A7Z0_TRYB9|nr:expression site-associated gene (ESAG) protein,putative [Trypanosoma brucei gambiense DAL972]CBH17791.1 expression site-associated gene (ESAG) protein,putative [Trypanosoma brucei gambiense DAL972]|eukprot:XP_011780055.1 expression site-associated gene (ESAG) protein,putative [Trypanosoma brucei gambiense DAL972]
MSSVSNVPVLVLFNSVLTLLCCIIGSGQRSRSPFTRPALKPGGVKVAIQEAAVTPALPTLVEESERVMENLTIPEQKVNGLSLGEAHFRDVTVGSATVKFEEPNKMILKFWNVSATVPFTRFSYHSFWCHVYPCSGTTQMEIRNASMTLLLEVSAASGGPLNVGVVSVVTDIGDPTITLIGEGKSKVPKWLGGSVKDLFKKDILGKLEQQIITAVNPILTNKTREISHMFPIVFIGNPKIKNGQMRLALAVLPGTTKQSTLTRKLFTPPQPFPNWPVAVVSSYTALNNVFRLLIKKGHSRIRVPFPLKYVLSSEAAHHQLDSLCSGCASEASLELKTAPWLKYLNKKLFTVNFRGVDVAVGLLPRGGDPIPLFSMLMNVSVRAAHIAVVDSIAHAKLDSIDATVSVTSSRIDGLDSSTMNTKIRDLINGMVLPLLNFKKDGFPVPFDLSGIHLNITGEGGKAGVDPARAFRSLSTFLHLR